MKTNHDTENRTPEGKITGITYFKYYGINETIALIIAFSAAIIFVTLILSW